MRMRVRSASFSTASFYTSRRARAPTSASSAFFCSASSCGWPSCSFSMVRCACASSCTLPSYSLSSYA